MFEVQPMSPTHLESWSILTPRSGCRSKTSAILQMVHSPKVPHFTWRRLCGKRLAVQGRVLDGHSWPTRHVQGANTGQSPDGYPIALFLSRVVILGWVGRPPLLRHNKRGSGRTERLQR